MIETKHDSINTFKSFAVCYGKIDLKKLTFYDVLILEPELYSENDIRRAAKRGTVILGYISITEIGQHQIDFQEFRGDLISKHPFWDSWLMNISKTSIKNMILNQALKIKAKGFHGVFLDNLDNTGVWGNLSHMKEHLIEIIENIKNLWDSSIISINNGIHLLDRLNPIIDFVIFESIASDFDFSSREYRLSTEDSFIEKINIAQMVRSERKKKNRCNRICK